MSTNEDIFVRVKFKKIKRFVKINENENNLASLFEKSNFFFILNQKKYIMCIFSVFKLFDLQSSSEIVFDIVDNQNVTIE